MDYIADQYKEEIRDRAKIIYAIALALGDRPFKRSDIAGALNPTRESAAFTLLEDYLLIRKSRSAGVTRYWVNKIFPANQCLELAQLDSPQFRGMKNANCG